MNGTEFIAKILKTEGIENLTCFPSNPLIEAAAKEGIRTIAFRHERGAVMAADGYSRTSQRKQFGVALVQSQAGAENAMGGIAQAYADNIPSKWCGAPNSPWGMVSPEHPAPASRSGLCTELHQQPG